MKRVIDQTVLVVYCFLTMLLIQTDTAFIVAFLTALIYACANRLIASWKWTFASTIVFLGAAVLCPECLLFTPVILYSILEYRVYLLAAILGGVCGFNYIPENLRVVFFLIIGCGIAGLIQYQTEQYAKLDETFHRIRDDGVEKNILLKEKNQTLLQKQDYEIYAATLKERNRIAREIHDNVGHMLSRSILMVGAMKAIHGEGNLTGALYQLEDTLNAAMTSVRSSVHDLHDESINLKEVLESLAGESTFCPVQLEYDMGYDVPREIKYSFIAIVKEALHNVTKHSNATLVKIIVREHPGLYQLIVEDNGTKGLRRDYGQMMDASKGIGIRNMKERVETLGGNLQIQTDDGFRIFITVSKRGEIL